MSRSRRGQAQGWSSFLAAGFAFFAVMAGATVSTPLYPLYSDTFGFSPIAVTSIFAIYSAGVIGTLLVTGPWSDELGRRPVLLGGLALAAGAGIAFAAAPVAPLPLLLLARFLQGASVGVFAAAATLAVEELAPEGHDRLGAVGATFANMGGLGAGSILGGALALWLPWPLVTPYLVHLGMIALATLFLLRMADPVAPAEEPDLRAQGLDVPDGLRDLFVPAAIAAFSGFMVCGFMGAVTPSFMGDVLGFKGRLILIGAVAGLVFLASCIGQVIETRLPENRVLPIGMGVLTLGTGAITAGFGAQSLGLLLPAIALAGVGHGIAFKGGLSALGREVGDGRAAPVTASYFTVAYVAISIPVLVTGGLQMVFDLAPVATGYAAASTLLAALSFVLILRRQAKEEG